MAAEGLSHHPRPHPSLVRQPENETLTIWDMTHLCSHYPVPISLTADAHFSARSGALLCLVQPIKELSSAACAGKGCALIRHARYYCRAGILKWRLVQLYMVGPGLCTSLATHEQVSLRRNLWNFMNFTSGKKFRNFMELDNGYVGREQLRVRMKN